MYKNNKKKYLAIILTLAMVISLLPAMTLPAAAADLDAMNGNMGPYTIYVGDKLHITMPYLSSLFGGFWVGVEYSCPKEIVAEQYADIYTTEGGSDVLINYKTGEEYAGNEYAGSEYFTADSAGTYQFTIYFSDLGTYPSSSVITVQVVAASSSDATLKASSTVKGQAVTSLGTPNSTLGSETAGTITITAAKAADTSNAGSFITLFDKNESHAAVKVVKYASGASTAGFATDTAYANQTITDGDFFIVRVTAQDTTTVNYYRINVTVTPAPSSDATLKASSTVKGQMVTGLGTPNATLGSETAGTVTLAAAKAADTSNTGSFITLFDKNESHAAVKVVKYASGASTTGFATDPAYANQAITDGDFFIVRVTAQDTTTVNYYRINVTVTPAPSNDAGLTSILSQAITAGSEAGTSSAPKTASISVANAVSTVTGSDVVKHDAGATVTFYGTDSTFTTSAAGSVNLTAGAGTDVYIKVVAADSTPLHYKVTINRASADTNEEPGESTAPITPTQPADTGVEILVNGKTEIAATATTKQEGDQTVTTVVVDDKKIEEKLQGEGNNATVTIPVKNDADVIVGQLNGQTVKNMEIKEAVLEIKTENVTYTLPATLINIDNVSDQIGRQVELKDIKVNVAISAPPQDTVKVVEDTANKNNYQVIVRPIEFNITCSSGNKTVEVSKFNGYVERMVAIPEGIDPSKITTGIVLNSDGTFSHVPTVITIIGGKYYAKINSLTNSTYSVIWSPKTFKDVENHWAKDAVNDMGSRLVIGGVGNDMFEPDRDITRGEFAAIVVRALGLMRPGTGKATFSDVSKNDSFYDAISIAYESGIISGYGNGKFGPDDKITREQAMTMIARAMKITALKPEIKDSEVSSLMANYVDGADASDYAKTSIAACLKTGIITGRSTSTIAPKNSITRAEVAVIVQRLLQKSNLI